MVLKLEQKIKKKKASIVIIGMGYVGLPLALAYARAGFSVVGIDTSKERIQALKRGRSYIDDVSSRELKEVTQKDQLLFTKQYSALRNADCIVICVPTPLSKTKDPDLTFILSAVKEMCKFLRRGQLVVLESTTYPGTTEESIAPMIKSASGLQSEKDYYLGFSPERVDPANRKFQLTDIPKVVGGIGKKSQKLVEALYMSVFKTMVPVSSCRSAEMVKLLENTFRSVNIGLINEMAMICDTLKIDIWEVIEAAKTKPFGFMPFYPGPGIGGHCINIDSMYLAWKVRLHGYEPKLIELAQSINDQMPHVVVDRVGQVLNQKKKPLRDSKIFILGVAYKKNVRDTRESPALIVMDKLNEEGARIAYHDPHVPKLKISKGFLKSSPLTLKNLKRHDMILILTDHNPMDYDAVWRSGLPVLDTRNAMKDFKKRKNIQRL